MISHRRARAAPTARTAPDRAADFEGVRPEAAAPRGGPRIGGVVDASGELAADLPTLIARILRLIRVGRFALRALAAARAVRLRAVQVVRSRMRRRARGPRAASWRRARHSARRGGRGGASPSVASARARRRGYVRLFILLRNTPSTRRRRLVRRTRLDLYFSPQPATVSTAV